MPVYIYYHMTDHRTFSMNVPKPSTQPCCPPHATYVPCPREYMKEIFKQKILEINASNPNATFGFLTDDIRARLGHDFFVRLGISPSRVEVILLSDGTGTYNEFYKAFGDATKGKDAWNNYKQQDDGLDWERRILALNWKVQTLSRLIGPTICLPIRDIHCYYRMPLC